MLRNSSSRWSQRVGATMLALVVGSTLATFHAPPAKATPSAPREFQETPAPTFPGSSSGLADVACPSSSSCFAVGRTALPTGYHGILTEWDGTQWNDTSDALPPGVLLDAIACPAIDFCMATGEPPAPNTASFTAVWNGQHWSDVSPTFVGRIFGVDCYAADDCTAVGVISGSSSSSALIAHWNGTSWSQSVAAAIPQSHLLYNVSCPSATSCFAVGYRKSATRWVTLIEHFDGSSWTEFTHPRTAGTWYLYDVSCWSATGCVAIGFGTTSSNVTFSPIAFRFNGTQWTRLSVPIPYSTGTGAEWRAVDCDPSQCTALTFGHPNPQSNEYLSTVASLDLSTNTWTATPVDAPRIVEGWDLTGIDCTVPGCVAVGEYDVGFAFPPYLPEGKPLIVDQWSEMPRLVRTAWTPAEAARLGEIAAVLGQPPEMAQQTCVGVVAYLLGFGDATPTPVAVPDASPAAAITESTWTPTDVAALDSVRTKFVIDNEGATRLSVSVVSYLLGLGGQ